MTGDTEIRDGEVQARDDRPMDAGLRFIGRIRTPWKIRDQCPRQGRPDGPLCRIELFAPWDQALRGIGEYAEIDVLYWLDRSRRDLVLQNPNRDGALYGTFALRSPVRPNPIGLSRVRLEGVEDGVLLVRGLDCLDGTPLIDLKPEICSYSPKAPPKPGAE